MKVGLVFGGRSVEHLVSVRSARAVRTGLREAGYSVVPLGIAENGVFVSPEQAERALRGECDALPPQTGAILTSAKVLLEAEVDAVFPVVHGTWGEDGTLQGLCEMLDLPYVGANVAASALAMDKALAKAVLSASGIPVVEHHLITARRFAEDAAACLAPVSAFPFPVFVKPSVGGSSVGVRKVDGPEQLQAAVEFALSFHPVVLVERGIQGRELECAVLGFETLEASVIGEIVPGKDFYDYEDKYLSDAAELLAPAPLAPEVAESLRCRAVDAFGAIGGDGMARVDFFLTPGGEIFVNEINTLPGFTEISMYPRLWGLSGVPLPELVVRLCDVALRRHQARSGYDRAIRDFVAGATAG